MKKLSASAGYKINLLGWLWLLLVVGVNELVAQKVKVSYAPPDSNWTATLATQFSDYGELQLSLANWQQEQYQQAYWEASVDSIIQLDSLHFKVELHRGPRYRWRSRPRAVRRPWSSRP